MENLFKYATKELSQDAFLRWLFESWNDEKLKPVVIELLKEFCDCNTINSIDSLSTVAQWEKVDISIHFIFSGQERHIFIEDKTDSTEHNQLKTYNEKIEKKYNKYCYKVFYKTGLLTPQEGKTVNAEGWISFDIIKIYEIFKKHKNTKNIILSQYIEHLKHLYYLAQENSMPNDDMDKDNVIRWNNYFIGMIEDSINDNDFDYDVKLNLQTQCASVFIWKKGDVLKSEEGEKAKYRDYPTLEICSKKRKVNILCRDTKNTGPRDDVRKHTIEKFPKFNGELADRAKKTVCTTGKDAFKDEDTLKDGLKGWIEVYQAVLDEWDKCK